MQKFEFPELSSKARRERKKKNGERHKGFDNRERHATQIKRRPTQSGRKYCNCFSSVNLPLLSIILINVPPSKGKRYIRASATVSRSEERADRRGRVGGKPEEREEGRKRRIKPRASRGYKLEHVFPHR
ncbi:hypothetical protein WH47_00521 [Habropoda laboriosa]|uniref:Uncharacterized protein n=1 Tax=Habropoda laboriosa TaxID=597456 RepID=A0A0L7R472_9HYME|nr:hypothetical protein WH47_00521 [Habropoda laboriosa]